jgi:hypothetical protein
MRATITTSTGIVVRIEGDRSELAAIFGHIVGSSAIPTRTPGARDSSRPEAGGGRPGASAQAAPRKPPSAARARAMKRQGAYLAAVRTLPAQHRALVSALAREQGVAAALNRARQLAATND